MTEGAPTRSRLLRALPWVVVGVVMLALAAVAVVRLFVDDADESAQAASVREVASLVAAATEDLDIAGGIDLLCEEPIELYRMTVESTITTWQGLSGTQAPSVDAAVSDVDEGAAGSFVLRIRSDEDGLQDEQEDFRVFVDVRDGRSCVVGVGGPDARRPSTRFAAGGYSPVTSPPPVPRP